MKKIYLFNLNLQPGRIAVDVHEVYEPYSSDIERDVALRTIGYDYEYDDHPEYFSGDFTTQLILRSKPLLMWIEARYWNLYSLVERLKKRYRRWRNPVEVDMEDLFKQLVAEKYDEMIFYGTDGIPLNRQETHEPEQ